MTVLGTPRLIQIMPFSGYKDPSLPIGVWIGGAAVQGNVSGGVMTAVVIFALASTPYSGNRYSLEQLSAQEDLEDAAHNYSLIADNMEAVTSEGINQRHLVVGSLSAAPGGGTMINSVSSSDMKGRWLGGQAIHQAQSSLLMSVANLQTNILQMVAHGYVWGPRSILAEGGPRRPVNGLFSA